MGIGYMSQKLLNQKQIAARLGISPATVSLVLSKPDTTRASEKTKTKIFNMVSEDSASRLDKQNNDATILFILINDAAYSHLAMLHGAQSRAADCGLRLEVINPDQDIEGYVDSHHFKGVLVQPHSLHQKKAKYLQDHFRTVTLNALRRGPFMGMAVQVDGFGGMLLAVQHLVQSGHRRIAYLGHTSKRQYENPDVNFGREAAFREAVGFMDDKIISSDIQRVPTTEDSLHQIREILSVWREAAKGPTAVICFNDILAARMKNIADNMGIEVPDELSLIGFDNDTFCSTMIPRLTSIAPSWSEMGSLGVDLIQDDTFWRERALPYRIVIPCQLEKRDSVQPFIN